MIAYESDESNKVQVCWCLISFCFMAWLIIHSVFAIVRLSSSESTVQE